MHRDYFNAFHEETVSDLAEVSPPVQTQLDEARIIHIEEDGAV